MVFGSILLIAVCGGSGLWLAARIRRRPEELRQCLTALSLLDTEIRWGATPLPEACTMLQERMDQPWGGFFAELGTLLRQGQAARTAWEETIRRQRPAFCLRPDDWKVIGDVGKGLGRSDREEQHKQLQLIQHQLEAVRTQAAVWAEKQAKMWSYLGFLLGCAGVIFFI